MSARCARCVMPDTRPDLSLDTKGVCCACRWVEQKRAVDWDARRDEWRELCAWARAEADRRGNAYDCIAAVSGGKDSTFICVTALSSGLRPLGVSFEPDIMTPTGQYNLENLQEMGVDVIQVKKRRDVYRRWERIAFELVGDHAVPNHIGIFTSVTREAVLRGIPLLLFGENPQAEYGSPHEAARSSRVLDRAWLEEYGGLLGLRVQDMVDEHGFAESEVALYRWPDLDAIRRVGLRSEFLGHYLPWDTVAQARAVIDRHGFSPSPTGPVHGSLWDYENVDDLLVVWHDHLMFLKYGYGRACQQASIAIRHGHLSREDAIPLVRERDGRWPAATLDAFCRHLDLSPGDVIRVCDSFTNQRLFRHGADGCVVRDETFTPILLEPL